MSTWIAVLTVGVACYVLRAVPLFVPRLAAPPPWLDRTLVAAGAASITALTVTAARHQLVDQRTGIGDVVASVTGLAAGGALALRRSPMWLVALVGIGVRAALTVVLVRA
jgi:branched-subunit amino acid transport protein